MAGETPGAAQSRRRSLRWDDDRSTNKIYASGQVSALGEQFAGDSVRKPGEGPKPKPKPKKLSIADERSTDKYYREGGVAPQPVRQPAKGKAAAIAKVGKRAAPGTVITSPENIRDVLDAVVAKLQTASAPITLDVVGDAKLLQRVRAAADMLHTRDILTVEQYQLLRFRRLDAGTPTDAIGEAGVAGVAGAVSAVDALTDLVAVPRLAPDFSKPPEPVETVDVSAEPVIDPLAFLNAGGDVESAVADDDADYGFLDPIGRTASPVAQAEPAIAVAETETKAQEVTEVQETPVVQEIPEAAVPEAAADKPRRTGRRSGRGT